MKYIKDTKVNGDFFRCVSISISGCVGGGGGGHYQLSIQNLLNLYIHKIKTEDFSVHYLGH